MERAKSDFIDTAEIKQRSLHGVAALISRTFVLQIIALVATFILTVLLDPATFGIFYVVTAIVNFLNYFSDIGLAAALIQKKAALTRLDLTTTFTIQQFLVGSGVVIALLVSSQVAGFYHLSGAGVFLLRALIISFFLSSLKTIPSVLLERRLEFKKLVLPQIIETLLFYLTAIILAARGMGVASFAWAALVRGVSGTVALYLVAPWKPGLTFDLESAKKLLSFGIPYQTNSFLALVKDDLLTVFLGKILPFSAIGYIGWAKKWSEIALRLIMDNIIKVTFPAFARLQHDADLLARAIEKSILFLALLALPIAFGMTLIIRPFIEVIPRYSKWEPALLSFYLFTISSTLAALSSPLVNTLNALGKVKYTFLLMLVWTALTWTLIPLAVFRLGYNGVSLSAVVIGLTSFMPVYFIRRSVKLNILAQMRRPLIATLAMTAVILIWFFIARSPALRLAGGVVFGIGTYTLIASRLMNKELTDNLHLFFANVDFTRGFAFKLSRILGLTPR